MALIDPNQTAEVMGILERSGAFNLKSHFVYAKKPDGYYHADNYVNKDMVFADPGDDCRIGRLLADQIRLFEPEVVVYPRSGAISIGVFTAWHLAKTLTRPVRCVYADELKDEQGFELRRNYPTLVKGKRCAVIDDVLTSGRSARDVVRAVKKAEGNVIVVAAAVRREEVSCEHVESPALLWLVDVRLGMFREEHCPLCAANVPVRTDLGHGADFLRRTGRSQ